jgi:hypothetical protein
MHTIMVLNPGHFHGALLLREGHPSLSEDVYVYSEEGPDLERFLAMVRYVSRSFPQPGKRQASREHP